MTLKAWNELSPHKRVRIAKHVYSNMPDWYNQQFGPEFKHSFKYHGEPEGCMVQHLCKCCKLTDSGSVEVTVKYIV